MTQVHTHTHTRAGRVREARSRALSGDRPVYVPRVILPNSISPDNFSGYELN